MENKIFKMFFWWADSKTAGFEETQITEKEMKRFLTNSSPNTWIETRNNAGMPVHLNTAHMESIFFEE